MKKRAATGLSLSLAIILGIAIFFSTNFKTVVVSGSSMEETYHHGQRLLSSKAYWLVGALKKKDVVVIRSGTEGEYFIKRIHAMPGEVVDWSNLGSEYRLTDGEYRVPEGHVWVIGDNRAVSEDSRDFGPVDMDRIMGKIVRAQ